jgi:hypothetical protein
LVNPLHLSGDYYQLNHGFNKYQPGTAVQDTRIGIRAIDQALVENTAPAAATKEIDA